jgi:streptomycin 6-kinase
VIWSPLPKSMAVSWLSPPKQLASCDGPQKVVVLHGDIHHGNVLDFGERGWLAIYPKGLTGERGFDYANIFCNPDLETATAPERLVRQVNVIAEAAGLERRRLSPWIVAWAGLSTAWCLNDNSSTSISMRVAELTAAELER